MFGYPLRQTLASSVSLWKAHMTDFPVAAHFLVRFWRDRRPTERWTFKNKATRVGRSQSTQGGRNERLLNGQGSNCGDTLNEYFRHPALLQSQGIKGSVLLLT